MVTIRCTGDSHIFRLYFISYFYVQRRRLGGSFHSYARLPRGYPVGLHVPVRIRPV